MPTLTSQDDLAEGIAALVRRDRRLRKVVRVAGEPPLRRRAPGFEGLARIIVGQQLSVASAAAIWARIETAFPALEASAVAAADDATLRGAGLSAPKIRTLRAIADACAEGLDLAGLAEAPAAEAHGALTAIKGVGPWTADIYLMFCLGHPDIFPVGDLALRNAVADAFGLADGVAPEALADMAARWSPWRTVAAHLFWAYYGAVKARKTDPI